MEAPWSEYEVVHLLQRATFSASASEINACLKLGKEETVKRLITGESLTNYGPELLALPDVLADGKNLVADRITDHQTYWLYRMVNTKAPLIEKMTLFWHGHFATSYASVREIPLLLKQHELFRERGLGSFRDLVSAIGKDPAMMLYLNANNNRKGKPNENYAREVMELFTLGIGNYTEEDVKAAARALTGWNVKKETGDVTFNGKQHDAGVKTILAQTGNFDEADLVNILFEQKALPQFIAKKLLQFFCTPTPSEEWISLVADDFANEKSVGEVLSHLFLSDRFYAPENRQSVVKSPAEYVACLVKAFELPLTNGYVWAMRKMGQELYLPPDVAGWRGGATWLMTTNLLARYQFAESVARKVKPALLISPGYQPMMNEAKDWVALWSSNANIWSIGDHTATVLAKYAESTFIHAQKKTTGMRGLLHLLMISPEAQMK